LRREYRKILNLRYANFIQIIGECGFRDRLRVAIEIIFLKRKNEKKTTRDKFQKGQPGKDLPQEQKV
jgi:hypothetical protein